MINLVDSDRPDLLVVSEANLELNNNTIKNDFPDYTVESKFLGNSELARIMVLIRSDLTYSRLFHLETDDNSMIVLTIKISKSNYLHVVCVYRQWKHYTQQIITLIKFISNYGG